MVHVFLQQIKVIIFLVLVMSLGIVRADQVAADPVASETVLISGPDIIVTVADYQNALLAVPKGIRTSIENDPMRRREFLFELYTERRLAREAEKTELNQQPAVQAELEMARRKILVEALVEHNKDNLPEHDFTELAEEYYRTHGKEFTQPERIRVAHILWSMKCDCEDTNGSKLAQAEAVLKELRDGADFAQLASKYSDDKASVKAGGDIGQWITRGILVKPFEDAAFALPEPGNISDVVKTEYGYHILKLLDRQPAGIQAFEQVKDGIIKKLTDKYRSSAHKAFVGQYYPTAEQFNNAVIDALPVTASPK